MQFLRKILLALLLSVVSSASIAGDPLDEYLQMVAFYRSKLGEGTNEFRAAIADAWRVFELRRDHPWTWEFRTGTRPPVITVPPPPPPAPAKGVLNYSQQTGVNTIQLTSGAFDRNGNFIGNIPDQLLTMGFSAVRYESSMDGQSWTLIGDSFDASNGYQVDFNFPGISPIVKASLLDSRGIQIHIFDSSGTPVTLDLAVAIPVPEPNSLILAITGLLVVVVSARRHPGNNFVHC